MFYTLKWAYFSFSLNYIQAAWKIAALCSDFVIMTLLSPRIWLLQNKLLYVLSRFGKIGPIKKQNLNDWQDTISLQLSAVVDTVFMPRSSNTNFLLHFKPNSNLEPNPEITHCYMFCVFLSHTTILF